MTASSDDHVPTGNAAGAQLSAGRVSRDGGPFVALQVGLGRDSS